MIVGKEGIHTWRDGVIVLNRRDLPVHYRVNAIPGLRAIPELDVEADAAIGRLGEWPTEADRLGKTISYEGAIVAQTGLVALREAQGALTAAFADTAERKMIAGPHPLYAAGDLPERRFHARPLSCDPDESQVQSPNRTISGGWEMPFTLSLRLSDPRYYHVGGEVDLTDDEPVVAGGGAGVPFTPGNRSVPPTSEVFTIAVPNPGNAWADDLSLELEGPMRNPVVSNLTSDKFLRFRDLTLDAGEVVTIDFRRRSARRANGNNVRHKLDPSSTWWDRGVYGLEAGIENTLRCRAYSIGAGAHFRVTYTPADFA